MRERIVEFVELNGLFPQPCGAPLAKLCKAVNIDWHTFKNWEADSDFSDALTHARAKFAQQTEIEIVNAMKKAALGFEYTKETQTGTAQKVVEFDPKTGKKVKEYTTEKLVTKGAKRVIMIFAPSVRAGTFLLANLAPDRWKQRQEIGGNITFDEETTEPVINIE